MSPTWALMRYNPTSSCTLNGYVYNNAPTPAPIQGASVTFDAGLTDSAACTTDSTGAFTSDFITAVPGPHAINASATGYAGPAQPTIVITTNGDTSTATITLSSPASISGVVTQTSGKSPLQVQGALVTIVGAGLSATTDSTGSYLIAPVPVGTYTVNCSARGFVTQSVASVSVAVGQQVTQSFSMSGTVPQTYYVNCNSAAWEPGIGGADTSDGLAPVWNGVDGPWHVINHGDAGINGATLNPGDHVIVEPGTYTPGISGTIMTLDSASGSVYAPITYQTADYPYGWGVVLTGTTYPISINSNLSYVTIDGFSVSGGGCGVFVGGSNCEIRDCEVLNASSTTVQVNGIYVGPSAYNTYLHNNLILNVFNGATLSDSAASDTAPAGIRFIAKTDSNMPDSSACYNNTIVNGRTGSRHRALSVSRTTSLRT